MPAYRAVLFDFFGTLTLSVRRGARHAHIARSLGCDPSALVSVLDRSFYPRARGALGCAEASLRWASEQAGGRPEIGTVRSAVAARIEAVRADTTLRDDAVGTLRALRGLGLRTAVVSDCTYELPAFLPWMPVAALLDAQIFSVDIGRCKPDPEMYLAACEKLDVAPDDCLYVGDGGSQELTGATRVGMTAVRLTAPDLTNHLVFNPDLTWTGDDVSSLSAVVDLVT